MIFWAALVLLLAGGLVHMRADRFEREGDPQRGDAARMWAYALLLLAAPLLAAVAVLGSQSLFLKIAEFVPAVGLLVLIGREMYRMATSKKDTET